MFEDPDAADGRGDEGLDRGHELVDCFVAFDVQEFGDADGWGGGDVVEVGADEVDDLDLLDSALRVVGGVEGLPSSSPRVL